MFSTLHLYSPSCFLVTVGIFNILLFLSSVVSPGPLHLYCSGSVPVASQQNFTLSPRWAWANLHSSLLEILTESPELKYKVQYQHLTMHLSKNLAHRYKIGIWKCNCTNKWNLSVAWLILKLWSKMHCRCRTDFS